MVQITQQLVASRDKTSGEGNPCDWITVHETANRNVGADAQAHANLQSRGNVRNASWQYTVDDHDIFQSFPDDVRCWHAGDGAGPGNFRSIGIEICVNADGDYAKAVANAEWLVQVLRARHSIAASHVVQHNHWSGKNCPTLLRSGERGIRWLDFVAGATASTPAPTPARPRPTGGAVMALPTINLNTTTNQWNPMVERIQALTTYGADVDCGPIDGRNGPKTKAGVAAMQVKYNCGDGNGGADLVIGDNSWASLLLGTRH